MPNSMLHRKKRTDLPGLESLALCQGGYFDAADASEHGFGKAVVNYHVRTGRFERVYPGVYRLRSAPPTRRDDLLLAWVWSNKRGVIAHESALELYGLSDVLPSRIHLAVPLNFARNSPGYVLHRTSLAPEEVTEYEGLPVTAPARTIVDAAASGTGPEQIELAVRQAIEHGLATAGQIRSAAARRRYRNRRAVLPMLEEFVRRATD
jgi:predicted transcriptional regulator of viral defense system